MQPDPHQNLEVIQDYCLQTRTVTKYVKGNFLGKGGFARCYQVFPQSSNINNFTNDNNTILAVKIIQKCNLVKQRSKQKLMSQIKIHRSLDHQRIVKFIHQFQDHANVYILLQLCPNKTLNDLIKRKRKLSQSQVRYYMFQLLEGLEYLHQHKVIHRDLKLGNLFLNEDMQIKIGDFGLATKLQYSGEKRKTVCGTPNYIAPQILQSKGHSCQVDVWSFGVIVYTLIYGRPPFQSKDVKQTYKKIKSGIFTFPDTVQTSAAFKYLITSALQKDPSKRPSIKQLKTFQFFRGGTQLSRQPSLCLKNHASSMSATKDEKQLSDNGKLYTNNQLITSKDTARQKSQDRFLATDRNMNSTNKSFRLSINNNVQRSGSQRVLRDASNLKNSQKLQSKKLVPRLSMKTDRIIQVKKWIDYSSKYGIGYVLSNGNFGVYFNDSTKILSQNDDNFYYIQRKQREDVPIKHLFKNYPIQLKKKVSLFNHFKGYLQNQSQNRFKFPMSQSQISDQKDKNLVYVRRWFRSKNAVVFRLSNKSVQVIFIDQTQLLISATNRQVVYINKHKQRIEYLLSDIMQSQNRQLIKRFQYTKEILSDMANNGNNGNGKQKKE